jgi:flagellar biogenesis protein FliO
VSPQGSAQTANSGGLGWLLLALLMALLLIVFGAVIARRRQSTRPA